MFTLPKLDYGFGALEPHIDARTMEIHYTQHHQGYVNKLNAALEGRAELLAMKIEELVAKVDELPKEVRPAVRNQGGGHANHSFFWKVIGPDGGGQPTGELAAALNHQFSSFTDFQAKFTSVAMSRFGSGWAWLVIDQNQQLQVISTPNQDSPFAQNQTPILGVDVWEHAYYLNYQNRRADYMAAFWQVVNWQEVARRFSKA